MAEQKFTDDELRAALKRFSTQKDIAQHFGVSNAAVSKRVRQLKVEASVEVVTRSGGAVVQEGLDTVRAMQVGYDKATSILQIMDAAMEDDPEAKKKVGRLVGRKGSVASVLLTALGEQRKHAESMHRMLTDIYSLQEVAEFQRVVLNAIREVGEEYPEATRKIMAIVEREANLRQAMKGGM